MSWDTERAKRTVLVVDGEWSDKQMARHVARNLSYENTFTILNVQDVIRKATTWMQLMPRIQPFYAVKCNYNPVVLEVLAGLGMGFDCASMIEIDKVLATGINPNRIVFAHTAKPRPHVLHARRSGVNLLTFDSHTELLKIKVLHPAARLLVRIRCDAAIVINPLGQKFGCCPYTEAPALLKTAKELNIKVVGVCFHVGSGCGEAEAFNRGVAISRRLFDLGKDFGHRMELLDIGGGYPGDRGSSIVEMSAVINHALDEYFPASCGVKIISEPGRYFVASAFTLACNVHSARVMPIRSESKKSSPSTLKLKDPSESNNNSHQMNDSNIQSTKNGDIIDSEENGDVSQNYRIRCVEIVKESKIFSRNDSIGGTENQIEVTPHEMSATSSNNEAHKLNNSWENCIAGPSHGSSPLYTNSVKDKMANKHIMYFMDNGLYTSFAGLASNRLVIEPEPLEDVEGPLLPSSLWGPTCDGIDIVVKDILLPPLPLPSWLLFHSFGAYTTTTSTKFNGFGEPTEHAFVSKATWNELMQLSHFKGKHRLTATMTSTLPTPLSPGWPPLSALTSPRTLTSALSIKEPTVPKLPDKHSPLFSVASPTSTVQSPISSNIYSKHLYANDSTSLLRSCLSPSSTVISPSPRKIYKTPASILSFPGPSTSPNVLLGMQTPPSTSKNVSFPNIHDTEESTASGTQGSNLVDVLSPMYYEVTIPSSPTRSCGSPTPTNSPRVQAY